MTRWYEGRADKPDIKKDAPKKKGISLSLQVIWREFFGLIRLNLLFILTSIPIVTFPASLTAMSRITATMVRDENYFLWKDYWKAFKRDFGKSLLVGFAYILIIALLIFTTYFYYSLYSVSKLMAIISGIAAVLALLIWTSTFYCFTMLSLVDLPVGRLVKNALVLVIVDWKHSLLALLEALILTVGGVGCLPVTAIFVLFIEFSLTNLLTTLKVYPIVEERVMLKPEEEKPETPKALEDGEESSWKDEDFE